MIWSTNYFRLACQTLFTLFFAGRDFAPKCIINGMNIQDYLTTHYLNAFRKLAERIRDAGDLYGECVIGVESLNEPSEGYLSHENLNDYSSEQAMKRGTRPTPAQSMRLGMGVAQTVQNWSFGSTGPKREGLVTVDPKGVKAWMDPSHEPNCVNSRWGWKRSKGWKLGTCIWALHDVWDPESGYILIPDYFHSPPFDPTRRIDFVADYWRSHWRLWSQMLRDVYPECIHFIQPPVFVKPPRLEEEDLHGRCCYTPHYYDGLTLVTRHWNWFNADALGLLRGKYKTTLQALRIGEWAIRRSLQDQLGMFLEDAKESLGAFPTLISEIGTPFDMDGKRAYQDGPHFGDYTEQQKALDASLNGADGTNCLSWTVWSYCPDNNHNWGDGYNLEDLSIWSADDLVFRGGVEGMDHRIGENLASVRQSINDQSNTRLLLTGNLSNSSLKNELSDLPPVVPPITPFTPFHLGNPSSSTVETFDEAQLPRSTGGYPLRNLPADDSSSIASTTSVYDCGAEADNLYDFLTNGARAVGAFCRPWPIAVVGVPKDIQFNISKADFKLVVSVTDADVAAASKHRVSPSSSARSRSLSEDTEKEAILPTEIYLPLVHYSADPFTKRLKPLSPFRDPSAPNLPGLQLTRPSVESRTSADPSSTAYSSSGSRTPIRTPTPAGGLGDALATMAVEGHGNSQAPVWATWAGRDCPLALVVEASEGSRWEVDGQVLKWWYPVTAPAVGEKSVDSAQEHWIRVRRAEGPIKGIGSAEIYLDEEGTSCWDACCPKWM
ncbi:uncharacterized protein EI90DRAFT_3154805 [Cantharellus anzutake]|uniref:uncharacterized protein n=1 Tax=Cantharellus anzutake TaxID=1750568 RepID=UPI001905AE08|nr:uncharacterized protein EI90DRAFT_3154805 [Cantharellus anzutake]KAF8330755.1 hypothetical protein EI90DRAFT_3154805 [Cantharellus anzutake]